MQIKLLTPKIFSPKIKENSIHLSRQKWDVVQIGQSLFSGQEKKLMSEVRDYTQKNGVETARIINKRGVMVPTKPIEHPFFVTPLYPDGVVCGKDFGFTGQLAKGLVHYFQGTMIHSHTLEVPLSSQDLIPLCANIYRKVIAVTPNGAITSIERPKNKWTFLKTKSILKERQRLSKRIIAKGIRLGLLIKNPGEKQFKKINFFEASPEQLKAYSDYTYRTIKQFAEKFGFDFKEGQL